VKPNNAYEQLQPQLQSIAVKLLSGITDLNTLLSMVHLLVVIQLQLQLHAQVHVQVQV
jgi:hypothetical protein